LDLFTIGTGPVVVLNDAATAGFDADGFGAVESIGSEGWVRSSVQAARELLAEASPTYLNWVSRVVRHFVPLKSVGSMIVSGSDPSQPGVIFASPLAGAALAAEVLVHEASHQYMHILCRLGLVDDGDPTPKYYSPVKGTMRPLWGIVTAFHAFANVSLYYREICRCPLTSQMDREYCTVQNEHLMPQLDQLRMSLRDNPALSWIGRALVEPLFQTIDA
jgi:HEXXH motif-containing protein